MQLRLIETLPDQHDDATEAHPAVLYLSGLGSDKSRAAMLHGLRLAAGILEELASDPPLGNPMWIDWRTITYSDVMRIRAVMLNAKKPDGSRRWAPASINVVLAAVKGTCREAWRIGLIDSDRWMRIQDVKSVPLPRTYADDPVNLRGRRLDQAEIGTIVHHLRRGRTALHTRDLALLAVLYLGALRRQEACDLTLDDVDLLDPSLMVRHGKGNKARTTYLHADARVPLMDWIAVRGDEPGPLFVALSRHGTPVVGRRGLTPQAIWCSVRRWCRACDLPMASPHDFRRSRASNLLEAGVDLSMVQRHLGHAQVTTTTKYDRRASEASRAAAQRLGF